MRGKNIETEEIPAYAAVAMAGLGWLPDTILSRSVIVRMRRRHAGERVEPYRRRVHAAEGCGIRDMIAAWTRSVSVEWPELPNEIQDRDADVWEPLVAVADAIGGQWPLRRLRLFRNLGKRRRALAFAYWRTCKRSSRASRKCPPKRSWDACWNCLNHLGRSTRQTARRARASQATKGLRGQAQDHPN